METIAWNPWHGCHKCSEGCRYCTVFERDFNRGINTNRIKLNRTQFRLPVRKIRDKSKKLEKYELKYNIPSGSVISVCETSDFFLEEADVWRIEAWEFIHERKDCLFIINTRRPERIDQCLPSNWLDGWYNVIISISIENDETAWYRMHTINNFSCKHLWIDFSPVLEEVDIQPYLSGGLIERVVVRGESYIGYDGLPKLLDLSYVKKLKEQCEEYDIDFEFRSTGSRLKVLNGQIINIKPWDEKPLAEFYGLSNFEHSDAWKVSVEEIELHERAEQAHAIFNKINSSILS